MGITARCLVRERWSHPMNGKYYGQREGSLFRLSSDSLCDTFGLVSFSPSSFRTTRRDPLSVRFCPFVVSIPLAVQAGRCAHTRCNTSGLRLELQETLRSGHRIYSSHPPSFFLASRLCRSKHWFSIFSIHNSLFASFRDTPCAIASFSRRFRLGAL